MSALAKIPNDRPQPITYETFEGFRIGRGGALLAFCEKPTFEECRDACALATPHKQQFVVRRTDKRSGAVTIHVFQIKQGARQYRGVIEGYVRPQRAEQVSVICIVEPHYPDEVARRVGWPVGPERPVANEAGA